MHALGVAVHTLPPSCNTIPTNLHRYLSVFARKPRRKASNGDGLTYACRFRRGLEVAARRPSGTWKRRGRCTWRRTQCCAAPSTGGTASLSWDRAQPSWTTSFCCLGCSHRLGCETPGTPSSGRPHHHCGQGTTQLNHWLLLLGC